MAQIKILQVRVGCSIDSLKITRVNDDNDPHFIDSPYFTGNVVVRIKDFNGITPDGKKSTGNEKYFDNKKRMFAIQVTGRFKHDYILDDLVFGAEFEKKVIPPTGSWMAIKFANVIDPALEADLYAEKPWFQSPIFCAMNILNVEDAQGVVIGAAPSIVKPVQLTSSTGKINENQPSTINSVKAEFQPDSNAFFSGLTSEIPEDERLKMIPKWKWGPHKELTENSTLLNAPSCNYEADAIAERRKHLQKDKIRKSTIVSPSKIYHFEIFAPFMNLNTFDLSLGININAIPYLNNQPIRMMAKSKQTGKYFFIVEFDLVPNYLEVQNDTVKLQKQNKN